MKCNLEKMPSSDLSATFKQDLNINNRRDELFITVK
jgi:hypothetical protein